MLFPSGPAMVQHQHLHQPQLQQLHFQPPFYLTQNAPPPPPLYFHLYAPPPPPSYFVPPEEHAAVQQFGFAMPPAFPLPHLFPYPHSSSSSSSSIDTSPIAPPPSYPPPPMSSSSLLEPASAPPTIYSWQYSSERVGEYDLPARLARLERYQAKRRELKFRKVRYASRSEMCLQRKRVGGRFVKAAAAPPVDDQQ